MSRVIHLRTTERNIAACFLIMESNGHNTKVPISAAVHTVLDICITGLISNGSLQNFDIMDAASIVKHYTQEQEAESEQSNSSKD